MPDASWTQLDPLVAAEFEVPALVEDAVLACRIAEIMKTPRPPSRPESIRYLVACARAAQDEALSLRTAKAPGRMTSAVLSDAVYTPAAWAVSDRDRVICGIDLGVFAAEPDELTDADIRRLLPDFTGEMWDRAGDVLRELGDLLPDSIF